MSSAWIEVGWGDPEVELSHAFTGLDQTLYRWRARVLHAPGSVAPPPDPSPGRGGARMAGRSKPTSAYCPCGIALALISGSVAIVLLGRRRATPWLRVDHGRAALKQTWVTEK
jgi:hypothetical protein